MNKECEQLVQRYVDWLKRDLSVKKIEKYCELTTPFLDRHNDHIRVYADKKDGTIELSDDGYILTDLEMSGLDINSEKRKKVLQTILNGYGVKRRDKELVVEAGENNLGERIHMLVQAMLAINDMFVMAQPYTASFFLEDVQEYLNTNEVRYNKQVKITGKSGYNHQIDFLVPPSQKRPERMLKAINRPNKNNITSCLWTVQDVREIRDKSAEYYAFLNDQKKSVSGDLIEAIKNYQVIPAKWSNREKYVSSLAN